MIRLAASELRRFELRTRMPFKYGIATLTELPHVFLHAVVEIDGRAQAGIAADHLPPKWFTKDPARDPVGEIDDMLRVIRRATELAGELAAPDVFTLWRELYARQAMWAAAERIPPLLAHFGTSLVERAVLDAFARHHRTPLHRLLHVGALGIDLAFFHPELAGTRPADWLSAAPLERITVRHTVGLADPLTEADIASGARLGDGLPQSLEECIRIYGLKHFKLKIAGGGAADLDRLERLGALLERCAPADYACSLDGNESFHEPEALREFLAAATARPRLASLRRRLLFLEQPLHRSVALAVPLDLGPSNRSLPVIIDESDAETDSLRRALALGYAGTSHKNCKGVFKGIANACRLAQLRRQRSGERFVMSGEDLSNIGPVALLQDLAVQALLGVTSVERNGHHYFAGLSFWPEAIQTAILSHHGDLYTRSMAGWPRVEVRDGEIRLGSVNAAPFGVDFVLPPQSS